MSGRLTCGGLGLLILLVCVQPVRADEGERKLTPRRTWGLALFGGSAVLLKKGWDFHGRADDAYALYRKASIERDAEDLFARAENNDTKSQMSFLVATAFALAGWQFWTGDKEGESKVGPEVLGVAIEPRLEWEKGRVGVRLKRRFF